MTRPLSDQRKSISPQEAWDAVCAGRTVCIVVGDDPADPVCLHYLDRCYEDFDVPMIYTESIGGWSEGVKEAICEPHDEFYVGFVADPVPLSLTITNREPSRREARRLASDERQADE